MKQESFEWLLVNQNSSGVWTTKWVHIKDNHRLKRHTKKYDRANEFHWIWRYSQPCNFHDGTFLTNFTLPDSEYLFVDKRDIIQLSWLFAKGPKTISELTPFSSRFPNILYVAVKLKHVNSKTVLGPFANNLHYYCRSRSFCLRQYFSVYQFFISFHRFTEFRIFDSKLFGL
jgi:hypothetical protein